MKKKGPEPPLFVKKGTEVSLSSPAFKEILTAVIGGGFSLRFQAKGFSMSPFIRDGDVITVAPMSEALPKIGGVVAFFNPQFGKVMVHRIVGKKKGSFLIRGDNSPAPDGMIAREHILGQVRKVERQGKKVSLGIDYGIYGIAFLSRRGILIPLLIPLWRIFRAIVPSGLRNRRNRRNGGDNHEVFS